MISAPSAAPHATPSLHSGFVAWFDDDKGFGFLTDEHGPKPSDPAYFVSSVALQGVDDLHVGDHVAYELVPGSKGPQAAAVRLLHCVIGA